MTREFVDTNIFLYAHDANAGRRYQRSLALLTNLTEESAGCSSIQVLAEFYCASTAKLGVSSQRAEEIVADLGVWIIHRPGHADLLKAAALQRRLKTSWWDALLLTSALELGCAVLWSEDLRHGQRIGALTIRNPFLATRARLQ